MHLKLREHTIRLGDRPIVMGILNVTPDSFWDGGLHASPDLAVAKAHDLAARGADIIDIGGESTRPGSGAVSADEEIRRIGPVVERLVDELDIPLSIDTRKARVARTMLELGAHMVNDISGLTYDPDMAKVVREFDVPVVIMHMRGTPEDMQSHTDYEDVVVDVRRELLERVAWAESQGIRSANIIVDPGIGFAKTADQCIEILARLEEFSEIGHPILVGPSRKSFIGKTIGLEPEDRLEPTIAACVVAVMKGADVVRVHDVGEVVRALRLVHVIRSAESRDAGVA